MGSIIDSPADRILPLISAGLFGTGALPDRTGVLISLGGDSVDLAIGVDATTAFTEVDAKGRYRFRVYERLALRIKDRTAIALLEFQ